MGGHNGGHEVATDVEPAAELHCRASMCIWMTLAIVETVAVVYGSDGDSSWWQ